MRRFFCVVCPPLAVLLCGKPISAIFNAFLCVFFWLPGMAHAFAVVNDHLADKRTSRVTKAIRHIPRAIAEQQVKQRRPRGMRPELAALPRQPLHSPHVGTKGTKFKARA